jgi:hypothetical protein
MLPLVIGSAVIGAVLMGRTKPKTKMRSLQMFGPKTGTTYTVEVMPGDAVIAVHDNRGNVALMKKTAADGASGYTLLHPLKGTKEGLLRLMSDF